MTSEAKRALAFGVAAGFMGGFILNVCSLLGYYVFHHEIVSPFEMFAHQETAAQITMIALPIVLGLIGAAVTTTTNRR